MTGSDAVRVVVCAGGLGTRIASWARYIPKEFYPVDGRPGIVHLLEEIAALGPAEVVIVCHPYYRRVHCLGVRRAQPARPRQLPPGGRPSPAALAGGRLTVSFITQDGPYADITSVLNGAGYLASSGDLYVAFADNLYRGDNPLLALHAAPPGQLAVLARPYQPELAASRGVIAAVPRHGRLLMVDLTEKPAPATARALEKRYGTGSLLLLEGRVRLTPDSSASPAATRHQPYRAEAGASDRRLRPHSPGRRDHDQQPGHRPRSQSARRMRLHRQLPTAGT